jgi:hypothetical protein
MRTWLLTASLLVATASNAHAMGAYSVLGISAWSTDGAAALLTRDSSSSGTVGTSHDYLLVDATGQVTLFAFTRTQDPATRHEQVSEAQCEKEVSALRAALKTHKLAGITLDPAQCKTEARDVVTVSRAAQAVVARSAFTAATAKPNARELAALAVQHDDADHLAEADGGGVFAATDKLVITLTGMNGDDTTPAHAAVFAKGKRVVDDLRSTP